MHLEFHLVDLSIMPRRQLAGYIYGALSAKVIGSAVKDGKDSLCSKLLQASLIHKHGTTIVQYCAVCTGLSYFAFRKKAISLLEARGLVAEAIGRYGGIRFCMATWTAIASLHSTVAREQSSRAKVARLVGTAVILASVCKLPMTK